MYMHSRVNRGAESANDLGRLYSGGILGGRGALHGPRERKINNENVPLNGIC